MKLPLRLSDELYILMDRLSYPSSINLCLPLRSIDWSKISFNDHWGYNKSLVNENSTVVYTVLGLCEIQYNTI